MPLDNYPVATLPNNPFPNNDDLFFGTETEPLKGNLSHRPTGRWEGIYRTDNGECLGVHKDTYTLVQNRDFFNGVEEKLMEYFEPDKLQNIVVKDTIGRGGAASIREYRFNKIKTYIQTERHSTSLLFRVIGWNCFDGSAKARIVFGNIDTFCTNGQITGEYQATSAKRSSRFEVKGFINRMEKGLTEYSHNMKMLQRYADTPTSLPYVTEFFDSLIGKGTNNISERTSTRLTEQYVDVEAPTRGSNLWAVVSTLTTYSSYADMVPVRNTGTDHAGVTLLERQSKVNKWLGSSKWDVLCNKSVMAA